MGHLPIVNQATILKMISDGCISTRGSLGKLWIKTTSDILSDVLATRKGDLIFPWIIHGEGGSNIGFKHVFKVADSPIFVKGDEFPVKIPLQVNGLEYGEPLSEADALDLWDKELLWNAIGKKSLGRGRSLTHQTPMEDEKIIELLNERNPSGPKKIRLKKFKQTQIPICIDPRQNKLGKNLLKKMNAIAEEDRLRFLDFKSIPWRRTNLFSYEKTLEAWLMANIDKPTCKQFRKLAFDDDTPIRWFANYLPFGVQGGNIDLVALQEKNGVKIANVIELKVGPLNQRGFEEAAMQALDYSVFIGRALRAFGEEHLMNVVVVSGKSNIIDKTDIKDKHIGKVKWVGYEINSANDVIFLNQVT
jgi:hypothetical protein